LLPNQRLRRWRHENHAFAVHAGGSCHFLVDASRTRAKVAREPDVEVSVLGMDMSRKPAVAAPATQKVKDTIRANDATTGLKVANNAMHNMLAIGKKIEVDVSKVNRGYLIDVEK
jgi:hypothetical protein